MAERTKKQRSAPQREEKTSTDTDTGADTENTDRLKEELDGLLDEIDQVLETNA
ncbi:MAG: ubiquitin-like protein Pup, partial [Actinomycetota bacterium]